MLSQESYDKEYVYLFRASTVHPVLAVAIESTGASSKMTTLQFRKESIECNRGTEIKGKKS
jgi:hypothetical protein